MMRLIPLAAFAVGVSAAFSLSMQSALNAQSKNCQLLSEVKPTSSPQFNDVWGYVDPATGRECAILGGTAACYVIETTVPTAPVLRGTFTAASSGWSTSTWSDMKEWKGFAYVVTEGGGGMKVIDLRNMDNPTLVTTWGTTLWTHAHNIALDMGRGIVIVHGTGGTRGESLRFIDVDTTPGSPVLLATWAGPYQHDLSMQNGLLHGSEIYAGRYALYDVSQSLSSPRLLGSVRTPRTFTHNTWPTYDDRYCVTTDERSNGPMAIYDISSRTNPVFVSQYHAGPSTSIIHNAYVLDYVAHMSHYTEGYRSVDISDPSNPVEVAYYDSWAGASSGYEGAWGCHCFQPSGIVYLSDITRGLLVLKPASTTIRYGKATAGTGGKEPHGFTIGSAYVGNTKFQVACRNAAATAPVVTLLSPARANLSASGLNINVDVVGAVLLTSLTTANGESRIPLPIANTPSLNNIKLAVQHFVVDAAGSLGFSATKGLELTTFTR